MPSLIDSAIWGTLIVSAGRHSEDAVEEGWRLGTDRAGDETSGSGHGQPEDGGDSEHGQQQETEDSEQQQATVWKASGGG